MDFNDYSTEEKHISWKPVAIVAGGIILAILVVVGIIRLIRGGSTQDFQVKQTEDRRASIEQTCKDSPDKEECKRLETQKAAAITNNVELCKELSGREYNGCVWEIAENKSDPNLCQSISDEKFKLLCSDGINYSLAVSAGNIAMCDKIQDETKKTGCKNGLDPVTVDNCTEKGQDPAECEMLKVAKSASQKQDPRVCDELDEGRAAICRELVLIDDPDFDGLSSAQETEIYGTDIDNSDTDRDGYKDGDEVKAGYNPNGAGRLKK